jgi:hypothetical protein
VAFTHLHDGISAKLPKCHCDAVSRETWNAEGGKLPHSYLLFSRTAQREMKILTAETTDSLETLHSSSNVVHYLRNLGTRIVPNAPISFRHCYLRPLIPSSTATWVRREKQYRKLQRSLWEFLQDLPLIYIVFGYALWLGTISS